MVQSQYESQMMLPD